MEDASDIILKLETILERIDKNDSFEKVKIVPLSISGRLNQVDQVGRMDSISVGLSLSHHVDESFRNISNNYCELIIETPLFLPSVSKDMLEAFRSKVKEIGEIAGFECDNHLYNILKTATVKFSKT